MNIKEIREQIDLLDNQLLEIFNRRAALALRIGALKEDQGLAIYDPDRERLIYDRMKRANPGPLDDGAVTRLFERVIEETRSLEGRKTGEG